MSCKDKIPKENRYFETDNGILYIGDCLRIMNTFPEKIFDAIITDLPYGITACKWDSVIPFDEMWACLKKIRKDRTPIVLFGSEPFSSALRMSNIKEFKYDWIWDKEIGSNFINAKKQPLRVIEIISIFYKKQCKYNPIMQKRPLSNYRISGKRQRKNSITGISSIPKYNTCHKNKYPTNIIKINSFAKELNSKYRVHPTQKPLALLEYLLKTYTNKDDLVLDFTCGSGTTLIACEKLNRHWIGIEIEKDYCKISKNRLKEKIC